MDSVNYSNHFHFVKFVIHVSSGRRPVFCVTLYSRQCGFGRAALGESAGKPPRPAEYLWLAGWLPALTPMPRRPEASMVAGCARVKGARTAHALPTCPLHCQVDGLVAGR
jgi:hypothetical protein